MKVVSLFSEKMNKEKDNTYYIGNSHHQVGYYRRVSPYGPPHVYKFLWCVCVKKSKGGANNGGRSVSKNQRILRKIVFILERIITENDLGEVFNAPCDVYLER